MSCERTAGTNIEHLATVSSQERFLHVPTKIGNVGLTMQPKAGDYTLKRFKLSTINCPWSTMTEPW